MRRLHPAQHDALTGLAHRGLGHARLEAALAARPVRGVLLVAMLDLERLRSVNAALGYAVGDRLLQEVARRLSRQLGAGDTAARFGSDEFLVLLRRDDAGSALRDAAALVEAASRPVELDGLRLRVRARAGAALHPADGDGARMLLRRADLALAEARTTHASLVAYRAGEDERQLRRLAIVEALRDAVAGGQLRLEYQPALELRARRPRLVEALLRWSHPAVGALAPDEFIPIAEESGQIGPLTRFVLDTVLRQMRAWEGEGLRPGVAVNVSALDLSALDLPAVVDGLLRRHGVDAARLTLEITETALMRDPDAAGEVLARLRALGVRLALDDFGVGLSSLARLRGLPVHELKIDRSFVRGLRAGTADALLVRALVDLGHGLGLRVVAEGVEDAEAVRVLAAFGCDAVQGFAVSPPLPPDALAAFLRARAPRAIRQALPSRIRSASA